MKYGFVSPPKAGKQTYVPRLIEKRYSTKILSLCKSSMSEQKEEQQDNFQNKALSDVENFLLLLSELNIIDSEKTKNPQTQQRIDDSGLLNIDHKDDKYIDIKSSKSSSRRLENEQDLSAQSKPKYLDRKSLDIKRSPNGQNSLANPKQKS